MSHINCRRKLINTNKLTIDKLGIEDIELSWLDDIFTKTHEELLGGVAELGQVPLHRVLSPTLSESRTGRYRGKAVPLHIIASRQNFLELELRGLCKLSDGTRKKEIARLNKKWKRRKQYTKDKRRRHHTAKAATKKEYNNKRWEKAPLERLKYTSRKPVHITQEDWDRCIAAIWNRYDRKYLKLRCSEKAITVHNLLILYHPPKEKWARKSPIPVVVYDGYSQAVHDSMKK